MRKLLVKFIIFIHDCRWVCPLKRKDGHYFKVIFNMFLYKHLKYIVLWLSLLIKSHSLVFVSYRYNPEPWVNVNYLLCLLDGLTYINMKAEHFKLFFKNHKYFINKWKVLYLNSFFVVLVMKWRDLAHKQMSWSQSGLPASWDTVSMRAGPRTCWMTVPRNACCLLDLYNLASPPACGALPLWLAFSRDSP